MSPLDQDIMNKFFFEDYQNVDIDKEVSNIFRDEKYDDILSNHGNCNSQASFNEEPQFHSREEFDTLIGKISNNIINHSDVD